jgi:hypothetical protein
MKTSRCAAIILIPLLFSCTVLVSSTQHDIISVPHSDRNWTSRLPSPDRRYALVGTTVRTDLPTVKCPACYSLEAKLWLENTSSHARTLLLSPGSSASAGWSPDGSAFFVNDREGSNQESAYIYLTESLKKLDLDDRILAVDPGAERFVQGHAYFEVNRWQGNGAVEVWLSGHTDEAPVQCFLLRYRVSRSGIAEKLSEDVRPVDRTFCGWIFSESTKHKR